MDFVDRCSLVLSCYPSRLYRHHLVHPCRVLLHYEANLLDQVIPVVFQRCILTSLYGPKVDQ